MKKIILFLCLVAITPYANAQKCKYDTDTKDAFSGKKSRGITAKVSKGIYLGFNLMDDAFSVRFSIEFFGEKNQAIAKGDSLLIKLSNNEIIRLAASEDAAPTSYVTGSGTQYANVGSNYRPNYFLSNEDFQKLARNMITTLRFYFGQTPLSTEVDEGNGKKIMHAADCMLQ